MSETQSSGGSDWELDREMAARMAEELDAINQPPADEKVAAARQVGQAMRRVIDRLTATSAPPEVLERLAGHLTAIAEDLGPFDAVRRYEGSAEASGLSHDRAFFDWSPLMGLANPLAPPIRAAVVDGRIVARATFGIAYEGPPGCVHGGYIAAAFDEVLGVTQSLSGRVGMTGTLTIKYRRPTPLNRELVFEGWVDSVAGRKVTASGRLLAGEDVTAEATGLFVTITPERFASLSAQRERRPD